MVALSRELGSRGRADAVALEPSPSSELTSSDAPAAAASADGRLARLEAMKLGALIRRAVEAGVDAASLDAAEEETDDPKAAVISLLAQHEQEAGASASSALRQELEALGLGALLRRAKDAGIDEPTLDAAVETDEPKTSLVQLLLACESG